MCEPISEYVASKQRKDVIEISVPEGKRKKGKLAVETECMGLLNYILDITVKYYTDAPEAESEKTARGKAITDANVKWFAEYLRAEAVACLTNIQEANKIRVTDDESLYERRLRQTEAERSAEHILTTATLMYGRKLIKAKRAKYIGQRIAALKALIQAWRKSDKERYNKNK